MELTGFLQFTFLFGTLIYIYQLHVQARQECERLKRELEMERNALEEKKTYKKEIESHDKLNQYQKELTKWKTEKEDLHKRILSAEQQKHNIEVESKLNKVRNEELSKEIEALQKKLKSLTNSIASSNKLLEKSKEKIFFDLNTEFEKQYTMKDLENDKLKRELDKAKKDLVDHDANHHMELNNISAEVMELERSLDLSAKKIESLDTNSHAKDEKIHSLEQEIILKDKDISDFKDSKEKLESIINELESSNRELNSSIEEKSFEIESCNEKITLLEENLEKKELELDTMRTESKEIRDKLNIATEDLSAAKNKLESFESNTSEISSLKKELTQYDLFTENCKELMEGDKEFIISGVKSLLDKVGELTSEIETQKAICEDLHSRLDGSDNKNDSEIADLKNKLQQQQSLVEDLSKTKEGINEKLANKELQCIQLSKQLKEAENQGAKIRSEDQELRLRIASKDSQIENLTTHLNNSRENEQGVLEELLTCKKKIEELQNKVAALTSQLHQKEGEIEKSYQTRILTLEKELIQLKEEIDKQKAILARNLELLRKYRESSK